MAEIKAFKGLRYNPQKVQLQDVVTQPYDKITPSMQSAYYERSPYNIVRLILGKDKDPYQAANKFFNAWQEQGIFIRDDEPSIYPYYQEYRGKVRKGFIALLKLEDFSRGVVLPHEMTLQAPKEDRLKLLRATNANFELIFMLYSDKERKIADLIDSALSGEPLVNVSETYESDAVHKLWRISDKAIIQEIQLLMETKSVLIADGHHRYETALTYSKERVSASYTMVTFVGIEDPGLLILPTHRAIYGVTADNFIENVSQYFDVDECKNKEEWLASLNGRHLFGLYDGSFWRLKLKDACIIDKFVAKGSEDYKKLDVTVLHKVVLEGILGISEERILRKECIDYLRDVDDGIKGVDNHKYRLFFRLNPTRIDELKNITQKHELMPQKSTDFYPKLISGLVLNKLE